MSCWPAGLVPSVYEVVDEADLPEEALRGNDRIP